MGDALGYRVYNRSPLSLSYGSNHMYDYNPGSTSWNIPPLYTPNKTQENEFPRTLGNKYKNSWNDEIQIVKKQNTGPTLTLQSLGIDPTKLSQLITNLQQTLIPETKQTRPPVEVEKKKTETWGDVENLFQGYDDGQKAAIRTEREKRIKEQENLFATKKLCLVLDLDHTILNSVKFDEVNPAQEEILRKMEEDEWKKPRRHLFRLPHMKLWTKLRPGIWTFLEKASKLYELHICTMGNQLYAEEMAKLLDPTGALFSGRVISKCGRVSKDLEGVLGMESTAIIVDDTIQVWPQQKLNLINLDKYVYFPSSRRQLGLPGPSLLDLDRDEQQKEGALASTLAVIERIHHTFFSNTSSSFDEADVRCILAAEKRKVLVGCRILFSRIFPVDEAKPQLNPLWQTAEQFGAVCTTQMDSNVTHVVASKSGTDKVNWALSTRKIVVSPSWIEASGHLYRRANETDFRVK